MPKRAFHEIVNFESVKILIEAQYFPPIQSIAHMLRAEEVFIEAWERYERRSYRNRCHIAGPNGMLRLSVPLIGGKSERQLMREKQISYEEDWQKLHWASLCSCYRRSPFFEFYEDDLEPIFQKEFQYLYELNMATLQWALEQLGESISLKETDSYVQQPKDVKDLRSVIHPKLAERDPSCHLEPYIQVFEEKTGFLPDLSILDLLFALGPSAKQHLLSSFVDK